MYCRSNVYIQKNCMTASLTVRQQAFRQAKRENDEINRWGRLGDGPPTTVMAVARRRLAAAVQTVVGGPHTHRRRGRQRGREAPRAEKDVYICHVGAILDMLCRQNRLSVSRMSKNVEGRSKQKLKYVGYDRHIGTQT